MNQEAIKAEQAGKDSFTANIIESNKAAERYARKNYNSVFLQNCFVAGWNMAYWDEQARVLKASK